LFIADTKMPSMFRDYLELVVGINQPITKKASFQTSYLTALSGKRDMRAQEKTPEPYRSLRGPVADRVNDKDYKYDPLCRNTYGLTPRKITAKQQRERE
jgi:Myofilin